MFVTGHPDEIISRGGEKIVPREIDEVFLNHPKVEQAVTFGIAHSTLGQDLAVAIVPRPGISLGEGELRSYALENLADWQLPSRIVFVKEIPKGPRGEFRRSDLNSSLGDVLAAGSEPQTAEERTLIELWQKVLNGLKVGVHDNFFSLSGSSLGAVQLALEIERIFGISVPPAALYQAPTVREFSSNFMRKAAIPEGQSLIRLSWGTHPLRLFCLPGNMGNIYKDLGALAMPLHPLEVYAFQDSPDNPARVEALAAKFVKEMLDVDDHGPYALLGVCSGAIVAFEMAHQLKAMGKEMAFLAMVEPSRMAGGRLKGAFEMLGVILRRILTQTRRHSRAVVELSREERRSYLRIRWRFYAIQWAIRRYRARRFDGRIHLYLTEESVKEGERGRAQWGTYAQQGSEVCKIPGTHDSITGANGVAVEEAEMQCLALRLHEDLESPRV